ncbi:MAG: hypothetical protein COA84_07050 [Robiginitomaculum sp.]|nr:MAG: hypothetical protein COA84_07050 [Robiginitomaculum sp.]
MQDILIVVIPSLIAIVIMVLLIKATGIARPVLLKDEAPVRRTIAEHFEGEDVERIMLSEDGNSALAFMKNGEVLLVRALGDRMAVRSLNANVLASLLGHENTLELKLKDFTWPRTRLIFEDVTARQNAENAISTAIDLNSQEPIHA